MLPYLLIKTSVLFESSRHALSNLETLSVDGWAERHSCWNTTWGGGEWRSECVDLLFRNTWSSSCWRPLGCVQAPDHWFMSLNEFKWITYLKGRALNPPGGPSVIVTFLLLRRKQDGFLLFQHSKSTKSVKASSEQHVTTCDLYFTIR